MPPQTENKKQTHMDTLTIIAMLGGAVAFAGLLYLSAFEAGRKSGRRIERVLADRRVSAVIDEMTKLPKLTKTPKRKRRASK
jgi:hypothetical protein